MFVIVNGERRELEVSTVADLFGVLGLVSAHYVVERNGVICERPFEGVCLSDGDVLEIVQFVGGGAVGDFF